MPLRVMNALIEGGKLTHVAQKRAALQMLLFLMDCTKIKLSYMGSLKNYVSDLCYLVRKGRLGAWEAERQT